MSPSVDLSLDVPEFWVDTFDGSNDDAKVAQAISAAAPVNGTVRFGSRTYSCGTVWVFDGCFPLGTSATKIKATTPAAAIRIGKSDGAAPGNYPTQPVAGCFRFDGNGIADGRDNGGYAVLTNAVAVTYLAFAVDNLDPDANGLGIQGQNNLFVNVTASAGGPGFCIVFDYGTGGNTILSGNPTGGNIIEFRQSGPTLAGYEGQPQNNMIENLITDYRPGVDSLQSGDYCIRHKAGWLNVIRNINAFHPNAKALIKFEKQDGPGAGAVNGGLFLEGLCQWVGGGVGKGQYWVDANFVTGYSAGPAPGASRVLDVGGRHIIAATEKGCVNAGTTTPFRFSFASISRWNQSLSGPWWTPYGAGAQTGPQGVVILDNKYITAGLT